jgi:hypothetical protein
MLASTARPWVAAVIVSIPVRALAAQVDYRNLDEGRPARVTDAYPVERFAFELSVPYQLSVLHGAARHRVAPQLDYGIARNVMLGVGADLALGGSSRGNEPSVGRLSVLWNPKRETVGLPGLALAVEATGSRLQSATVVAMALATRSVGQSRVHLNLAASVAAPTPRTESPWWAGIAWDRTLFRASTLVVADLTVGRAGSGGSLEVVLGGGMRSQLTPTVVLHAGLGQSLTADGEGPRVTLGLSQAFAVAGLMGRRSP